MVTKFLVIRDHARQTEGVDNLERASGQRAYMAKQAASAPIDKSA